MTTSTSGTSMIPAFKNWSASPEPGWTTTATVSTTSATSTSLWPTPTVSITTTSKAVASAWAAARVAGARPPRRPPAAVERMNVPGSVGSKAIRARSPSSEPRVRREDGSTARTATDRAPERQVRTSSESSEDFPTPGGPVTPTTWPGASPPSAAGATAFCSSATSSRAASVRFSTRFSTAGAALRSPARSRSPSSVPELGPPARPAPAAPSAGEDPPLGARRHPTAGGFHAAAAAAPFASATTATMSAMISVRSKSFGV